MLLKAEDWNSQSHLQGEEKGLYRVVIQILSWQEGFLNPGVSSQLFFCFSLAEHLTEFK